MERFISKDVVKYLQNNSIELDDWQKAAVIYKFCDDMQEMLALLANIERNTKDEVLKRQINETIVYEKAGFDAFTYNNGSMVYELVVLEDDEENTEGYFGSYEVAAKMGRLKGFEYVVKKYKIFTESEYIAQMDELSWRREIGEVRHNSMGQITYCWSDENTVECPGYDEQHFENIYMKLPQPFRKGDVVVNKQEKIEGVVVDIKDDNEWEDFQENMLKRKMDSTDIGVPVVFWTTEGRILCELMHPYMLEYL